MGEWSSLWVSILCIFERLRKRRSGRVEDGARQRAEGGVDGGPYVGELAGAVSGVAQAKREDALPATRGTRSLRCVRARVAMIATQTAMIQASGGAQQRRVRTHAAVQKVLHHRPLPRVGLSPKRRGERGERER